MIVSIIFGRNSQLSEPTKLFLQDRFTMGSNGENNKPADTFARHVMMYLTLDNVTIIWQTCALPSNYLLLPPYL